MRGAGGPAGLDIDELLLEDQAQQPLGRVAEEDEVIGRQQPRLGRRREAPRRGQRWRADLQGEDARRGHQAAQAAALQVDTAPLDPEPPEDRRQRRAAGVHHMGQAHEEARHLRQPPWHRF